MAVTGQNIVVNPSFEQQLGLEYASHSNELCALDKYHFCSVEPKTIAPWIVTGPYNSSIHLVISNISFLVEVNTVPLLKAQDGTILITKHKGDWNINLSFLDAGPSSVAQNLALVTGARYKVEFFISKSGSNCTYAPSKGTVEYVIMPLILDYPNARVYGDSKWRLMAGSRMPLIVLLPDVIRSFPLRPNSRVGAVVLTLIMYRSRGSRNLECSVAIVVYNPFLFLLYSISHPFN
jgi:hypothetical protein